MLGAGDERERRQGNDIAVIMNLNGVLVRLLALVVPALISCVPIITEFSYFSCQPEREALV